MANANSLQRYLTPKDVAGRYGCNLSKIIYWLKTGQLQGINIAADNGKRPRWRISPEAVAAFEASRSPSPPAAPAPRQRRQKRDPSFVEYV